MNFTELQTYGITLTSYLHELGYRHSVVKLQFEIELLEKRKARLMHCYHQTSKHAVKCEELLLLVTAKLENKKKKLEKFEAGTPN